MPDNHVSKAIEHLVSALATACKEALAKNGFHVEEGSTADEELRQWIEFKLVRKP